MANEISQIQGIDNTFVNWSIKIKSTLISLEDTLIYKLLTCTAVQIYTNILHFPEPYLR